jgi:hypothetical protein
MYNSLLASKTNFKKSRQDGVPICSAFCITFRTHDASEPDLEALLLDGACHPVKRCGSVAQATYQKRDINPLPTNTYPRATGVHCYMVDRAYKAKSGKDAATLNITSYLIYISYIFFSKFVDTPSFFR